MAADKTVAVVTGASRGAGLGIAHALGSHGCTVYVTGRTEKAGQSLLAGTIGETAELVTAAGGEGIAVAVDHADDEQTKALFDRVGREQGRLDILVNNAALARSTRFESLDAAEWRQALETNMTAPFLLIRTALPAMKAQAYGRVVNISSSAGRTVSTLGGVHYTASKAGLLGLTRAAAKELGKFGVTVNAVCPGMIDTELTREHASPELLARLAASYPVPRLGTPLEVSDLICFLASDAAGYITGASIDINGGDLMM
jgi:3-oxoacyl-[acyl-carrier protein] reductase